MKKLFAAVAVIVLALGAFAAPATAASGGGAVLERMSGCESEEGLRICYKGKFVSHEVSTPSGNTILRFNAKLAVSFSAQGYAGAMRLSFTERILFKAGRPHVGVARETFRYTDDTGTCKVTFIVRYLKGDWKVEERAVGNCELSEF